MRASQARLSLFELVDRFRALLHEQPSPRTEVEISEDCDQAEAEILDFATASSAEAAVKLAVIADGLGGGLRSDGRDVRALREVAAWLSAAVSVQRPAIDPIVENRGVLGRA